eukprot:gene531-546_t
MLKELLSNLIGGAETDCLPLQFGGSVVPWWCRAPTLRELLCNLIGGAEKDYSLLQFSDRWCRDVELLSSKLIFDSNWRCRAPVLKDLFSNLIGGAETGVALRRCDLEQDRAGIGGAVNLVVFALIGFMIGRQLGGERPSGLQQGKVGLVNNGGPALTSYTNQELVDRWRREIEIHLQWYICNGTVESGGAGFYSARTLLKAAHLDVLSTRWMPKRAAPDLFHFLIGISFEILFNLKGIPQRQAPAKLMTS